MNADTAEGTYRSMATLLAMSAGRAAAHGEQWPGLLSRALRHEEYGAGAERSFLSLLLSEGRVPHISLVFCEMWDTTAPSSGSRFSRRT